jgi:hypothetical protein
MLSPIRSTAHTRVFRFVAHAVTCRDWNGSLEKRHGVVRVDVWASRVGAEHDHRDDQGREHDKGDHDVPRSEAHAVILAAAVD